MQTKHEYKIIVFFIGGAGEKSSYYFRWPHHSLQKVKELFEQSLPEQLRSSYEGVYLDYREAYKDKWEDKITRHLPDKDRRIFIIGHSLGAWNGAHLSTLLHQKGYQVRMLLTLDPVGRGFWVYALSRIYFSVPKPVCDYWINIKAEAKEKDSSDIIAELGERWEVGAESDINESFNVNHYDTGKMMTKKLSSGYSAMGYLLEQVTDLTQKEAG